VFVLFEDMSGLENWLKAETQQVNELTKQKSILSGEISELEKNKRPGCIIILRLDFFMI